MTKNMMYWAAGAAISVTALAEAGGECAPQWSALGNGLSGSVNGQAAFDDGSGLAFYAGGFFSEAEGAPGNGIAKWDGYSWSSLGSGLDGGAINLAVFDDGSGPTLIAGGQFTEAGGVPAANIAKWDGSQWSPLGSGLNSSQYGDLAIFNDGSGDALYVGGFFTEAGGEQVNYIAKWDGTSWSDLAGGVGFWVLATTVFDDGSGPALYVGGEFTTAGGISVNSIARWDGSEWSSVGDGVPLGWVSDLVVFDNGFGPRLYAAVAQGPFGARAHRVLAWDGELWTQIGEDFDAQLNALAVFDAGNGPELYAGGGFTSAGSTAVNHLARWNGQAWQPVGAGASGADYVTVWNLNAFDLGTGSSLYSTGVFEAIDGEAMEGVGRLGCVEADCPADATEDGQVDLSDLNIVLANFGSATTSGDADGNGQVDLADLNIVLGAFGSQCS